MAVHTVTPEGTTGEKPLGEAQSAMKVRFWGRAAHPAGVSLPRSPYPPRPPPPDSMSLPENLNKQADTRGRSSSAVVCWGPEEEDTSE